MPNLPARPDHRLHPIKWLKGPNRFWPKAVVLGLASLLRVFSHPVWNALMALLAIAALARIAIVIDVSHFATVLTVVLVLTFAILRGARLKWLKDRQRQTSTSGVQLEERVLRLEAAQTITPQQIKIDGGQNTFHVAAGVEMPPFASDDQSGDEVSGESSDATDTDDGG